MPKYRTEFDRQRFEARVGAMHGPTHIVDKHYIFNNPWNSHNDGSQYEEQMVAQGIWQRCEQCDKAFNPIYGHECIPVEVEQ